MPVARGEAYLEQTYGKELDPMWVNAVPHCHPDLDKALQRLWPHLLACLRQPVHQHSSGGKDKWSAHAVVCYGVLACYCMGRMFHENGATSTILASAPEAGMPKQSYMQIQLHKQG